MGIIMGYWSFRWSHYLFSFPCYLLIFVLNYCAGHRPFCSLSSALKQRGEPFGSIARCLFTEEVMGLFLSFFSDSGVRMLLSSRYRLMLFLCYRVLLGYGQTMVMLYCFVSWHHDIHHIFVHPVDLFLFILM